MEKQDNVIKLNWREKLMRGGRYIERWGHNRYNEKVIQLGLCIQAFFGPRAFDKGAWKRFLKGIFTIPWYYPAFKDKFKWF